MFQRMRRAFTRHSIRNSMILYFLLLIVSIVLALSITSFTNSIRETEQLSIQFTSRLLDEVNASIDSYIQNIKSMGTVVVENRDVKNLMTFLDQKRGEPLTADEEEQLARLKERASAHMHIVAQTRGDITNIAVLSKYRDVVLSDSNKEINPYSDYNLTDWYLKPMSYRDDIFVSSSHVQRLIADEYKWVISISKAIMNNAGEVTGVMLIDLNYRSIESICENVQLGKNGYIFLVDAKDNLIYHPQQQLIYSGVKSESISPIALKAGGVDTVRLEEENRIYLRNHSSLTDWTAVGVVNTSELITNRAQILQFYVALALVAILFSALFAVLISTNITRPIKKLEHTMHRVEEGDFSVQTEVERDDEIGHVSKAFNKMVLRVRALMASEVSKEEEKRKSEIKALQAQINPHFLYNTLETIIWMTASGKQTEVMEVTAALANLFRTSISQGDSLVEMRVEIENIESYLTIQKMRYKDKLSYAVDVPPRLLSLMLPKLILQPIVENAIYHGIKPSPRGGRVEISGRRRGDLLILTVEDDGVGMTEDQISALFLPRPDDSRSIGVLNVENRIKLVFGSDYGLHYAHREGGGTRVDIHLPLVEDHIQEEGDSRS